MPGQSCEWLNIDTIKKGSLRNNICIKVISEREYFMHNERAIIEENIYTTTDKAVENFEGIIFLYLTSVVNGSETMTFANPTQELFYLPIAGVFALKYAHNLSDSAVFPPGNVLATGFSELQRIVPMEANAKKIILNGTVMSIDLNSYFALIKYGEGGGYVIFRDDVPYSADDAVKFNENSVIFRDKNKFYYRCIGCVAKEIDWPKGIRLSSIRVHKNRIAFQTPENGSIYIGDIKWG